MKKFTAFCLLNSLFVLFAAAVPAGAQAVAPWFRGTAQSWKDLTKNAFSAQKIAVHPLSKPLSGLTTGYAVKTTVPNWLKYRLSHSNTFCRMEKEILDIHPGNICAVSGKLSYFWDRDALLSANASSGEMNANALTRHQELLQNTLAEVEAFGKEEIGKIFHSSIFSKEDIAQLLADPDQPPAFALYLQEIRTFPTLTLSAQQDFARRALEANTQALENLLSQSPEELSTAQYADYYRLKLRQRYFRLLWRTLENANAPRQTLIIRVRKQIELSFLPGNDAWLTDAERLGKLYFYAAQIQAHTPQGVNEQLVALKSEIARQEKIYEVYAKAEAFNIPYEVLLERPQILADYALGAEEAARLRTLPNAQAVEELPQHISRIQTHRQMLLSQKPARPGFYTNYYRLYLKETILQTRLAQANCFLNYNL